MESANYFSAGLKALSLLLCGEKELGSSAKNAGRMTNDPERQRLNDRREKAD